MSEKEVSRLQKSHIIAVILGIIITAAINLGFVLNRVEVLERDVNSLKNRMRVIDEVQFNLRAYMEHNGFKYTEIK